MIPENLRASEVVIVFGAYGLLGAALCIELEAHGFCVIKQSRSKEGDVHCNPSNKYDVCRVLKLIKPTIIINLIALSNVDYCEENLCEAYKANVQCVGSLTNAVKNIFPKPHLVHISTDHVYNGVGPHVENSVYPINNYAMTKFFGELLAIQAGATIFRTNFVGKSQISTRQSFSDWIFEALISKKEFTVFDDVHFSALSMKSLSNFIIKAIQIKTAGIFNVGTRDGISKAGYAMKFAKSLNLDSSNMRVGSIVNTKLAARRPSDMRLDVARFESNFKLRLPFMQDEIRDVAEEYKG